MILLNTLILYTILLIRGICHRKEKLGWEGDMLPLLATLENSQKGIFVHCNLGSAN